MPQLPSLICPSCHLPIAGVESAGKVPVATQFDDCLRRCEPCGIGASNASDRGAVTFIHRDPLGNIPVESREGASEALAQALNIRNRESKRRRFGFSTSEDAVTWVVFMHLLRSGQLLGSLRQVGLIADSALMATPTLLLWGAPVDAGARGKEIQGRLRELCAGLREDPNSFSEPDVIVDFGEHGVMFIEVKHQSGNDLKPVDYAGWPRYASVAPLAWRIDDVKGSGCYELARNWCLVRLLSDGRPATLVNLGPSRLFGGAEGARLDRFVTALDTDDRSRFAKVAWSDLLTQGLADAPSWFSRFCRERGLIV